MNLVSNFIRNLWSSISNVKFYQFILFFIPCAPKAGQNLQANGHQKFREHNGYPYLFSVSQPLLNVVSTSSLLLSCRKRQAAEQSSTLDEGNLRLHARTAASTIPFDASSLLPTEQTIDTTCSLLSTSQTCKRCRLVRFPLKKEWHFQTQGRDTNTTVPRQLRGQWTGLCLSAGDRRLGVWRWHRSSWAGSPQRHGPSPGLGSCCWAATRAACWARLWERKPGHCSSLFSLLPL